MNALTRYSKRLLAGDFSQGQAFWAILLPSLLLLKSAIAMLSISNVIENPVLSARLWLPVAAVVTLFILPLLFFTTAKSIFIASKTFKGGYQSLMLAFAVGVAGYLTVKDIVAHWPTTVAMTKIAFTQDNYDVRVTIDTDKKTLTISGQLTFGSSKLVEKQLNAHPDISTVELDLNAGHLHEARKLARVIYTRELNTYVERECLASCMLILVAGKERIVDENARLGFHRTLDYDNGYRSDWVIERERKRDRHYYGLRGVAPSYLHPIYYKQNGDVYFEPAKAELIDNGVITTIQS